MRGLLMALFAFDFPGHGAGRRAASHGSTTKIPAKTIVKTV